MAKSITTNSYRTTQDNKDALTGLYGSVSAGSENAVNAYVNIRPRVLRELKNQFTKEELSLIVDSLNGTIFDPKLATNNSMLSAGIEDSISFDGIDEKWGVDKESILNKITNLSAAHTYFLMEEISRFWNIPKAYGAPTPDLEAFLNNFE